MLCESVYAVLPPGFRDFPNGLLETGRQGYYAYAGKTRAHVTIPPGCTVENPDP